MSDLNEVSEAIGQLRADVRNLADTVKTLSGHVEGIQKTSWTARGVIAGLSLAGGAAGSKLLALFGGLPPSQHP
jgi:hypothetical protein